MDLDGDGVVNANDQALRDWALWKLKCDAFLPRAMSNNDAFESQMHANNRGRFTDVPAASPASHPGYRLRVPQPVCRGRLVYQIFRFDPIYTMYNSISGEPAGAASLDQNSNTAGYRYPYDRTHLGKDSNVPLANDIAGGLVNINTSNNNYSSEEWISNPAGNATPTDLTWYHINEAKWIYCYDPYDSTRT